MGLQKEQVLYTASSFFVDLLLYPCEDDRELSCNSGLCPLFKQCFNRGLSLETCAYTIRLQDHYTKNRMVYLRPENQKFKHLKYQETFFPWERFYGTEKEAVESYLNHIELSLPTLGYHYSAMFKYEKGKLEKGYYDYREIG